ncbi:hypothetical protein P153DRAFT_221079 [Dothidotthia symphoricarpi CBS 119687]|uniref:Uncharacterized protein n=1 Tax=Dothidotthia symphoricarpi CBS 119687 TaxID=1392245 RepID=A0A6A6AI30_9PLEO|nr:uncharacterized protein P153DRAFT_221079 [Dothidotthia symphoricarpi CBS 119687]KAF2130567.1 hypothetical protein P153DRAFT_221079 [Dothidotthia symphoricarpi CBS 119687]
MSFFPPFFSLTGLSSRSSGYVCVKRRYGSQFSHSEPEPEPKNQIQSQNQKQNQITTTQSESNPIQGISTATTIRIQIHNPNHIHTHNHNSPSSPLHCLTQHNVDQTLSPRHTPPRLPPFLSTFYTTITTIIIKTISFFLSSNRPHNITMCILLLFARGPARPTPRLHTLKRRLFPHSLSRDISTPKQLTMQRLFKRELLVVKFLALCARTMSSREKGRGVAEEEDEEDDEEGGVDLATWVDVWDGRGEGKVDAREEAEWIRGFVSFAD